MEMHYTHTAETTVHDWRLIEPLGEGASAEVWKAEDKSNNTVALKILTTNSQAKIRRFGREIDALAKIQGTGSLPMLECVRPIEKLTPSCYSMPIALPLKQYVRQHRPGIVGKVVALKDIAQALIECHAMGVAHCDVKPDNIFYSDGRWVLGDFGLCMRPGQKPATEPDEFLGTRHYVAPELKRIPYRNILNWSRCDSYSFALTMWETLLERRCRISDIETAFAASEREHSVRSADRDLYRLLSLARSASSENPSDRLTMTVIHAALERWLNQVESSS